ncbi:unnamed protein product [Nippostrongylus brasiliensis]|uniref:Copper transport protein n=1 Tax=Nippostrongylus brasiliensis TaxID=27835 RepID=A0A0N4XF06_NIPBR|nr:unnamed protein product [Nippostrongylus brasiliensis]
MSMLLHTTLLVTLRGLCLLHLSLDLPARTQRSKSGYFNGKTAVELRLPQLFHYGITMVALSQEMISVGVMVVVCVTLSLLCVVVWLLRCRRAQLRQKRDRHQHEIDSFNNKQHQIQSQKSSSRRAVADKKSEPKRAESIECEAVTKTTGSHKSISSSDRTQANVETQEIVSPAKPYVSRPLERINEEAISVRNVNVFPADKLDEIDFNPGLNSVINLETI